MNVVQFRLQNLKLYITCLLLRNVTSFHEETGSGFNQTKPKKKEDKVFKKKEGDIISGVTSKKKYW